MYNEVHKKYEQKIEEVKQLKSKIIELEKEICLSSQKVDGISTYVHSGDNENSKTNFKEQIKST